MKATKKIIVGIGLITATGLIIYLIRRHKTNLMDEQKAKEVAEHGYETAHDILFPKKNKRIRKYKQD